MSRSVLVGAVAGSLAAAAVASAAGWAGVGSTPGSEVSAGSEMSTGSGSAAGRGPASGLAAERARWGWPIRPRPAVVRPFRAPASEYGAGHRGLDLAAVEGTPVVAVESGLVTHAAVVAGRGTVTVEHPDGLRSTYEPVLPAVGVGGSVATGDLIGTIRVRDGPSHCGARACLHLGAVRDGSYLDPYPLLSGGRLALLPIG